MWILKAHPVVKIEVGRRREHLIWLLCKMKQLVHTQIIDKKYFNGYFFKQLN